MNIDEIYRKLKKNWINKVVSSKILINKQINNLRIKNTIKELFWTLIWEQV